MNIKRIKLIIISIWVLIGSSCLTNRVETEQTSESSLFLWKVEKNESIVYLAGSVHVAPEGIFPLHEKYYAALEESENFVMEADVNEIDPDDIQTYTMQRAIFAPGDEQLDSLLPLEYQEKLISNILAPTGITFEGVQGVKPWFLSLTLSMIYMQSSNLGAENGVDKHFYQIANELGLNNIYLETAKQQIDFLSGSPMSAQVAGLIDLIESWDTLAEETQELMATWIDNDIYGFEKLYSSSFDKEGLEPTYDILIKNRNIDWANQVEDFLTTNETYFIVVGAGHLVGDDSLLKILQERGYTVTGF